jgi:hypothetical protein
MVIYVPNTSNIWTRFSFPNAFIETTFWTFEMQWILMFSGMWKEF